MDAQEEEPELLLFPNLITTLETLLQETNSLKHTLSLQIKEANNISEWELPVECDDESEQQTPTESNESVDLATLDSVLEEIVSESIGNAVERARNVRKALVPNKSGNKISKTKSEQNNGKIAEKSKVGIPKDRTMTIKLNNTKSGIKNKPSTAVSSYDNNQKISNDKTEKMNSQLLLKRKTTHLESTYQRDYLTVAKEMQKTNSKSVTNKYETTKPSESRIVTNISKSNVFSFTDVDNLLSRVTPYENASTSSQNRKLLTSNRGSVSREEVRTSRRRTCEAGGKQQIEKLKLKKKTSLKDAINVVGMPLELETISKIYHKYLDQRKYFNEEEDTLKNEFLNQLKTQNKNELINGFSHCPDLQAKVTKLFSVAENMEEGNFKFKLEVKSTNDLLGGFSSNEDLCLYYSGREQLEIYEKKQDELMQLKLKLKVCDSILKDLNNSEIYEKQIVNVYKVVSALKDITSLSVPVIFKK